MQVEENICVKFLKLPTKVAVVRREQECHRQANAEVSEKQKLKLSQLHLPFSAATTRFFPHFRLYSCLQSTSFCSVCSPEGWSEGDRDEGSKQLIEKNDLVDTEQGVCVIVLL